MALETVTRTAQHEYVGQLPHSGVIFDAAKPSEPVAQAPAEPLLLASPDQGLLSDINRARQLVRADINLQAISNGTFGMSSEQVSMRHKTVMEAIEDGLISRSRQVRRQELDNLRATVDHWKISEGPNNV